MCVVSVTNSIESRVHNLHIESFQTGNIVKAWVSRKVVGTVGNISKTVVFEQQI